jgi:glycosyltransferase involved in cell wall biosynthesis
MAERMVADYVARHGCPDLFHAHATLWGGEATRRIARRYARPFVVTEHASAFTSGELPAWQVPDVRRVLAEADAVVAVSEPLRARLQEFAPTKAIQVIPNLVDTDLFRFPLDRVGARGPRVLVVGFLTPRKGVDILLRAFAEAFDVEPGAVLEIAGEGPQLPFLKDLARTLGVADRVEFTGALTREGVRDAMARADLFVLPSFAETFGVVLIEALATGLAVIATRCGGPESFVTPELGMLVEPGDVSGMAQALRRIEPTRCVERRRRVVERFGRAAVVEQLGSLYRAVVDRRGNA